MQLVAKTSDETFVDYICRIGPLGDFLSLDSEMTIYKAAEWHGRHFFWATNKGSEEEKAMLKRLQDCSPDEIENLWELAHEANGHAPGTSVDHSVIFDIIGKAYDGKTPKEEASEIIRLLSMNAIRAEYIDGFLAGCRFNNRLDDQLFEDGSAE